MLDIGEGRGALVIYTAPHLVGQEIEIRLHDGEWSGVHTAVRTRYVGDRVLYAGVFGSLDAGRYALRLRPTDADGHHHGDEYGHHHHGPGDHDHDAHQSGPVRTTDSVPTVVVTAGTVVETTLEETAAR
jgi:hypothetical protein